jgi:hypothetical protein
MKKFLFVLIGGTLLLSSCNKEAGSGGTSAITGNLTGKTYSSNGGANNEAEVTQITIPHGSNINDGEYILLNTPNGGTQYYLWFKWNNGVQPDPNLAGRTGIQVTFNFTESNSTVAANAVTAINNAASADYSVSLNNDIITLTNLTAGEVTDADELSDNLLVDIQNQGQSATGSSSSFIEGPIVDERVYIIYGEEEFYSDDVRTDENGNFQFRNLNRGTYTIFAFSEDTLNPGNQIQVQTTVEINKKKEVVQAEALYVVK